MNSPPLIPPLFSDSGVQPTWRRGIVWFAAALLLLIVHFPHDAVVVALRDLISWAQRTESVHNVLSSMSGKYARGDIETLIALCENAIVVPAKKAAFIVSVVVLLIPIVVSFKRASWIWERASLRRRYRDAALLFGGLAALIVPRFLQGFGDEYATMSLSPFTEGYGIFYRRFLMPSLANVLGASGYLFYFLFSLFVTYCLIVAVRLWLESYRVERSLLFSFSLMTSSFVIFNFQLPGYPEQIAFILLLACSVVPMNAQARVAAFALALSAHEAAALVFVPVAWFFFPRNERYGILALLLLYCAATFAGHVFTDFRFVHKIISDDTWNKPRQFFLEYPLQAFHGIFFGYKLFWLALIAAIGFAFKNRMFRDGFGILAIVLIPMALIAIASDASRIAGFGFFGLLIALLIVESHQLLSKRQLQFLAIANLIVPSCYVDLHSGEGMQLLAGAYRVVYTALGSLAKLFIG